MILCLRNKKRKRSTSSISCLSLSLNEFQCVDRSTVESRLSQVLNNKKEFVTKSTRRRVHLYLVLNLFRYYTTDHNRQVTEE